MYAVRITPADIGARVTVRARSGVSDHGPPLTDTVGLLRSWSHGVLEVERRDGTIARIAEADVVAAKTLPPAVERPKR